MEGAFNPSELSLRNGGFCCIETPSIEAFQVPMVLADNEQDHILHLKGSYTLGLEGRLEAFDVSVDYRPVISLAKE
jgi:hypothetical protein